MKHILPQIIVSAFALCCPLSALATEVTVDNNGNQLILKAPSVSLKDATIITESILKDLNESDSYHIFSANEAKGLKGDMPFLVWDIRLFNSKGDMMTMTVSRKSAMAIYTPEKGKKMSFRYNVQGIKIERKIKGNKPKQADVATIK